MTGDKFDRVFWWVVGGLILVSLFWTPDWCLCQW